MYSIAFFVKNPFSIEDLRKPCLVRNLKKYTIEKEIEISYIDYENLITDLCVEREYIERNKNSCFVENDVWHCLFVHPKNSQNGTLIMCDKYNYPRYAAYL